MLHYTLVQLAVLGRDKSSALSNSIGLPATAYLTATSTADRGGQIRIASHGADLLGHDAPDIRRDTRAHPILVLAHRALLHICHGFAYLKGLYPSSRNRLAMTS